MYAGIYVLEYVLGAVGMVARRKEGGSVYKSASCGAWVPSLPEPVWVGVCMCVSRDSQATTNLIDLQITQRNPPRALTPVRPLWPPSVLACGPPSCIHEPAWPAGHEEPGEGQETARRGQKCVVRGRAGGSCERASVQSSSRLT